MQTITLDTLSIIALVAGAVSIILGLVAIALSVWFFVQTKNTETATSRALEGIRSQTETLSKISGQQLKRLTDLLGEHVRAPDTTGDALKMLVAALENVASRPEKSFIGSEDVERTPTGDVIRDHKIPLLPNEIDKDMVRDYLLTLFLSLYYYTAYANFFSQNHLPAEKDYKEDNALHRMVRQLLDVSARDFQAIKAALTTWRASEPTYVGAHRLYQLGVEAELVGTVVRNSRAQFEAYTAGLATPPA